MTEPRIDASLLAAFLDGTATAEEREQVLRLIATSREAYDEFSEASAIRGLLHDEVADSPDAGDRDADAAADAPAPHPATLTLVPASPAEPEVAAARPTQQAAARPARFIAPIVMLAAAVLVVVVALTRRTASTSDQDVYAVAASVRVEGASGSGSLERRLGAGWDAPGWAVTRGGNTTSAPTPQPIRIGLRVAQLQLAVTAKDSAAIASGITQLQAELSAVDGSAPSSALIGAMQGTPSAELPDRLRQIATTLRDISGDATWFDLGLWLGAARIAATSGDAAFFASESTSMQALRALSRKSALPAARWDAALVPLGTLLTITGGEAGVMTRRAALIQDAIRRAAE